MNRAHLVLPLLAALCACNADRHNRTDTYHSPATINASAARSDMREPPTSLSSDDKNFIEKAVLGGLFEVQSSRIAQLKNVSRATMDFAQLMVDDHGRANRDLDLIAREKGLIPPMHLDAVHQLKLDELTQLDDQQFERAYRSAQATAHDDAIQLFERSAKNVDDPDVLSFIQRVLPTLREHTQLLMEDTRPK